MHSPSKLLNETGMPVLCDFGEACFGQEPYGEHVLPDLYRAPEILLCIKWNKKIDIWTLGLVVSTQKPDLSLVANNYCLPRSGALTPYAAAGINSGLHDPMPHHNPTVTH